MVRAKSRRFVVVAVAVASVMLLSGCDLNNFMPGTPRPSWCDPTDTAINDGHTTRFFQVYTTPKGPLSQSDCWEITNLQLAADFAAGYPTVASIQAAGWVQATPYTPAEGGQGGQGVHFVDPNRVAPPSAQFNPRRPNYLMYNGTAPTANLVGMMFLVDTGGDSTTTTPPAGFAGANDHWHNHGQLCYKANSYPFVLGEIGHSGLTATYCRQVLLGVVTGPNGDPGAPDFSSQWMVHVWLPPYAGWQATDIFNVGHPSL